MSHLHLYIWLAGGREVTALKSNSIRHTDKPVVLLPTTVSKHLPQLCRHLIAFAFPCDEVQRIPSALNTVQAILDGGARLRFLLTGSSARKLKGHEVNLLPGRAIQEVLDHSLCRNPCLCRGHESIKSQVVYCKRK